MVPFRAAEGEIGDRFGQQKFADEGAVGVEAMHTVPGCGPQTPGVVDTDAVEAAEIAFGEDLPAGQGAVGGDVENAEVAGFLSGVDDVLDRTEP